MNSLKLLQFQLLLLYQKTTLFHSLLSANAFTLVTWPTCTAKLRTTNSYTRTLIFAAPVYNCCRLPVSTARRVPHFCPHYPCVSVFRNSFIWNLWPAAMLICSVSLRVVDRSNCSPHSTFVCALVCPLASNADSHDVCLSSCVYRRESPVTRCHPPWRLRLVLA